jgi:hypothetical protein
VVPQGDQTILTAKIHRGAARPAQVAQFVGR